MKVRETDVVENVEDLKDIRRSRRKLQNWRSIAAAVAAAFAAGMGGGDLISYMDTGLPDAVMTTDRAQQSHRDMEEHISKLIEQNAAYNLSRWETIAKHMETQHAIVEALRASIESLGSKSAQVQQSNESLQKQINDMRQDHKEDRTFLLRHLQTQHATP